MASRQQRRTHLREWRQRVSKRGIELTENGSFWSGVALTSILLDFFESGSERRASNAVVEANRIFELSLKNAPPRPPIACKKGCAFCCYVPVSAFAPEIFLLGHNLHEQKGDQFRNVSARIERARDATKGSTFQERYSFRNPCPLLVDNECSVYGVRPSACRGFSSLSVSACKDSFENITVDVPKDDAAFHARQVIVQAYSAVLDEFHFPNKLYELNQALEVVAQDRHVEKRWLSGVDVFAHVEAEVLWAEDLAVFERLKKALIAGAKAQEIPTSWPRIWA